MGPTLPEWLRGRSRRRRGRTALAGVAPALDGIPGVAPADVSDPDSIRWPARIADQALTLVVDVVDDRGREELRLGVVGDGPDEGLLVRTLLVTQSRLVLDGGREVNELGRWPLDGGTGVTTALREKVGSLEDALTVPRPAPPAVNTTWWTRRANFGDLFGPILVHTITGRPVVHHRYADTDRRPLYTVGSVLTFRDVPGSTVWGSGLIRPLTAGEERAMREWTRPRIHAVRGRLTRHELVERLGWDVPEVYGDPALLAPRLMPPANRSGGGRPVVIPHGVHEDLFRDRPDLLDVVTPVSPSQGPQAVIDRVAGASHVLASSLHGVLTAHAFGVPWTWLRITDQPLLGDEFKFEDFFTGIEREEVARLDVTQGELTPEVLRDGTRRARRPRDHHDLDRLLDAFPELPA